MKKIILGYLETNTDPSNIWVPISKVYIDLSPEDDRVFESSIIELLNDGQVRFAQESTGLIKLGLVDNIQTTITEIKKDAISEMEEELQRCIEEENYEEASEWRDMINESKNE